MLQVSKQSNVWLKILITSTSQPDVCTQRSSNLHHFIDKIFLSWLIEFHVLSKIRAICSGNYLGLTMSVLEGDIIFKYVGRWKLPGMRGIICMIFCLKIEKMTLFWWKGRILKYNFRSTYVQNIGISPLGSFCLFVVVAEMLHQSSYLLWYQPEKLAIFRAGVMN